MELGAWDDNHGEGAPVCDLFLDFQPESRRVLVTMCKDFTEL
jgi:hypothetical protein